jgi:carbon monoxide dehydrogenase subunit G
MVEINKSQEAHAPIETVWKAISDVEGEQKYWPVLKNVKILSRNGNTIEREATIRRGPLGEAKSTQTLVVDPQEKSTALKMTKGPMLGTRKIALSSISKDRTKIDVIWQFEMKGVPGFALGYVKDNISEATEKALREIATETEGGRNPRT